MKSRDTGPRLGRGLAALIAEGEAPPSRGGGIPAGPQSVAVDLLEPGPFQPRRPVDEASLEELAASIRARGVLQPVLARPHPADPGRFQIIAGERRWRAAQIAELHDIPALIRQFSDAEAMAASLVENLQRTDLNAIEEADGYRRLIEEFGLTQEQLGEAVGKSRSHVANTMRLLNLPPTVQAELRNGALTAGHARALLSHKEPAKAALAVISRGLNVRQTEALVAQSAGHSSADAPGERRAATGHMKDPDTLALERDLSERLGLKVDILFDGRRGTLRLHYRSLEQLDGLVSLLSR